MRTSYVFPMGIIQEYTTRSMGVSQGQIESRKPAQDTSISIKSIPINSHKVVRMFFREQPTKLCQPSTIFCMTLTGVIIVLEFCNHYFRSLFSVLIRFKKDLHAIC